MNLNWIRTRKKSSLWRVGLLLIVTMAALAIFLAVPAFAGDREPITACVDTNNDGIPDSGNNTKCYWEGIAGEPVSGDGIVPELWNDNPSCQDMGFGYGFKIDQSPNGTFYFTSDYGDLTGGALPDANNYVTISNAGEGSTTLDWTASLGIDAVFVKGGPVGGNLYVYDPEDTADTGLGTPAVNSFGNPINPSGISHIEFCYDYELDVDKDANTSFTRTYDWTITKEMDATYDLFKGDTQDHKYTVSVDKNEGTDSDWAVAGSIYINNNTPFDATIASVSDVISGVGAVAVNCGVGFPYTLPAGQQLTCSYGTDLPNGTNRTNTATVETSGPVGGSEATAPVDFSNATITKVNDSVTVTDTNSAFGGNKTASNDDSWSYEIEFACNADQGQHTNTAEVTGDNDVVLDSDTATVTINCHELTVTKDATTSLTRTYEWDITKTPDATYQLFEGDTHDHKYTVLVDKTGFTDSGWAVSGNIAVSNVGNPIAAEITGVSDVISGSGVTNLSVSCGVTFPYILAAGGTLNCSYSADLPDATARTNTATATLQNYDYASDGTATPGGTTDFSSVVVPVIFDANTSITEVNDTVTVTDTNDDFGVDQVVSEDDSWMYESEFACDADEGSHVNTAQVIGDGAQLLDEDTATVTINCYDLTVTKEAEGTYDEKHTWDIEKVVEPLSQSGYPGDELSWEWEVTLSESSVDENFMLVDGIIVSNAGNPIPAVINTVADVVSGVGVTDVIASVECEQSLPYTIPAGETLECTFDAGTADLRAYSLNTATATLQNYDYASDGTATASGTTDYSGTAPVNYTKTVLNGTATVTDDQIGLNESLTAGNGPWEWTETQSHICSEAWADYGEDGSYSETLYNTATVVASNGQTDSADAQTTYTCEAGTVEVLKLTNGVVNPGKDWQFALYVGPDSFGGTQVGQTSSTLNDADGILEFGDPALRPDSTYTVCELGVPAGWISQWQVDVDGDGIYDATVNPYNPNADDDPPEDLGTRCVDFGAGTTIPVTVGTEIRFQVDNNFPGGAPRTPGYWKNWNRCTNGNQANTAEKNGGWEEGYWLLDDVLDPAIGGGIVWDDILTDDFVFPINSCALAVDILDKRAVGDPDIIKDGKKAASDPLHNLATHLLAAQLNFGAGACTTQDVLDAALAAETLLDQYNFDGNTHDNLKKKDPDADLANELASYLDAYNNGEFCGDGGD